MGNEIVLDKTACIYDGVHVCVKKDYYNTQLGLCVSVLMTCESLVLIAGTCFHQNVRVLWT